jgi:GNAT superfamily N-acetyltransferase
VSEISISQARPGQWADLRAVRLAALSDAPGAFGSTWAREAAFGEAEWRNRAANPMAFIAWRAGEPVGLVSAYLHDDGPDLPIAPEWELVGMWVRPDARGSGCADLLVSAVARAARARSARHLALWVAEGNARARAFYLRAGFEPTGVWQRFERGDGSAFDEERMVLRLAGA